MCVIVLFYHIPPTTSTPSMEMPRQLKNKAKKPQSAILTNYTNPLFVSSSITKPTVSLAVISLVASSCGYSRSHIEPRAAHSFAGHVVTQRGRAKSAQSHSPPCAQPVATCRRVTAGIHGCPRGVAPMRRHTASRDTPAAVHGRSNDAIASPSVRCAVRPPLLFAPPGHGLVARGYWSEALAMTTYEQHCERGRQEVYGDAMEGLTHATRHPRQAGYALHDRLHRLRHMGR